MGDSSRDPHFILPIEPHMLEDGTLEIPRAFVTKHGWRLPKHACLQVPTGAMWRVELKRDDGRVWLEKGWKAFVENCGIKRRYLLSFKYEGDSFFHVVICNNTTNSEIAYPALITQRVDLNRPQFVTIKEEDTEDDSSDECPLPTMEASMVNLSGDDEVLQREDLPGSSARDGAFQRARAFRSNNPHFIVIMPPMCHSHVYIPSDARSYFYERDDKVIYLNGRDTRAWFVQYCIEDPPMCQVRITSGWSEFAQHNRLQDGDACVFDLIDSTMMVFNVAIFHISEEEEEEANRNDHVGTHYVPERETVEMHDVQEEEEEANRNDHVETHDVPEQETVEMHDVLEPHTVEMPDVQTVEMPDAPDPQMARSELSDSAAHERAESSQRRKPSFTVVQKVNPNASYALSVPRIHASSYLVDQHQKEVFLVLAGKTWPLKCYYSRSNVRLQSGWKDFVVANNLQKGDTLTFELHSQAPNYYNVTICRAA